MATSRNTTDRLARIEEKLLAHMNDDTARLASIDSKLGELAKSVDGINTALTKQRGFIAGMVFVISALWALIAAAIKFKLGN